MPSTRSISEWLSLLEGLHPDKIELGLGRVAEVASRMSILDGLPCTITVAGTNGKGSCVAACQHILCGLGYRTGTYQSPHIHKFNERIRINGEPVTDEQLVAAFEHVDAVREDVALTYFEFTTLAALSIFSVARLDAIVLEVGLGGRLDAVNIVDPDVCVITSIGLDHTDWLGNTMEEIAGEKAGILRSAVPCVIGMREPWFSIASKAMALKVPLYRPGIEYDGEPADAAGNWHWRGQAGGAPVTLEELPDNAGSVARTSIATAIQACLLTPLGIDMQALPGLVSGISLEGRFEKRRYHGQDYILDVGHNSQAAAFVRQRLDSGGVKTPVIGVLGMLADKDARGFIAAYGEAVSHWYVAPLDASRSMSYEDWQYIARDDCVTLCATVAQALELVANQKEKTVIITGSFYTVEEAGQYFSAVSD